MSASFPKFSRELASHQHGYHRPYGRIDRTLALKWFSQRSLVCPESYLDFLCEVGPGKFFSGALTLFAVEPQAELDRWTDQLPAETRADFFAIGYDGTTEGCYCLKSSGNDEALYWHNWETGETALYDPTFLNWIERSPSQLFNETAYSGYKKIKSPEKVHEIIEQRRAFEVSLVAYEKKLVRPPGQEKDFLPRYNRVTCTIRKRSESELKQLTFIVRRTGSAVGADNRQPVTLSLPELGVGEQVTVDVFAFDPFNVRFEDIVLDYTADIDLGSPTRSQYAELRPYL
jgi:hypothetical protein